MSEIRIRNGDELERVSSSTAEAMGAGGNAARTDRGLGGSGRLIGDIGSYSRDIQSLVPHGRFHLSPTGGDFLVDVGSYETLQPHGTGATATDESWMRTCRSTPSTNGLDCADAVDIGVGDGRNIHHSTTLGGDGVLQRIPKPAQDLLIDVQYDVVDVANDVAECPWQNPELRGDRANADAVEASGIGNL